MRRLSTSGSARFAAVLASLTVATAVPVALGAGSAGVSVRATERGAEASSAETRARAAALTLYALEAELARARTGVAEAEARRAAIAAERLSVVQQRELAQRSIQVSERRLAELVRALYEQDGAEPLAILLGAGSLEEVLTGLGHLDRAAGINRLVLERTGAARSRLVTLEARLSAQERELLRASEAGKRRLQKLEAKAAERTAYVGSLRRAQNLTAQRVSTLEAQAEAAERRTSGLRVPAAPSAPNPPARELGRTLTVSSVGYSLPGRTASGLPVGSGVVAVDPAVIPLGTRMFVPGYGEAVAADTGSAVRGAMLDLWFPTAADALRWGRQTVVITLR